MEETAVYKCALCGNIVEVLFSGGGELVCCGQPMDAQVENHQDAATEKHVPVIERSGSQVTVTVGEVNHPMEEAHYIQWIELVGDGRVYRKRLMPGEAPVATFDVEAENIRAREYCNLHGLWSNA